MQQTMTSKIKLLALGLVSSSMITSYSYDAAANSNRICRDLFSSLPADDFQYGAEPIRTSDFGSYFQAQSRSEDSIQFWMQKLAEQNLLLRQTDPRMREHLVPNGGLCATTCPTNMTLAVIAKNFGVEYVAKIDSSKILKTYIELYRQKTGRDPEYGANPDVIGTLIGDYWLQEKPFGLNYNIGVPNTGYRENIDPRKLQEALNQPMSIGYASIRPDGATMGHAIVIISADSVARTVTFSDPNFPNQIQTVSYQTTNGETGMQFYSPTYRGTARLINHTVLIWQTPEEARINSYKMKYHTPVQVKMSDNIGKIMKFNFAPAANRSNGSYRIFSMGETLEAATLQAPSGEKFIVVCDDILDANEASTAPFAPLNSSLRPRPNSAPAPRVWQPPQGRQSSRQLPQRTTFDSEKFDFAGSVGKNIYLKFQDERLNRVREGRIYVESAGKDGITVKYLNGGLQFISFDQVIDAR